jgi:hypothetical protein
MTKILLEVALNTTTSIPIFFCNLQSRERIHTVLVIGLYELLDNPTT